MNSKSYIFKFTKTTYNKELVNKLELHRRELIVYRHTKTLVKGHLRCSGT